MAESLKDRAARYRQLTEAALLKVSIKAIKGTRDFARAKEGLEYQSRNLWQS